MGSLLSSGTSNADLYNQAAHNVACIAHMVATSGAIGTLERVSFIVIAPKQRITEKAFEDHLAVESLMETVRRRTAMFEGKYDGWFSTVFTPLLPRIQVRAISWENVVETIASVDDQMGDELKEFLRLCLGYNSLSPHRPKVIKSTISGPAA